MARLVPAVSISSIKVKSERDVANALHAGIIHQIPKQQRLIHKISRHFDRKNIAAKIGDINISIKESAQQLPWLGF